MFDKKFYESIEELGKKHFGWLTPTGTIITCGIFEHLDCLRDSEPIMIEYFREADALEEEKYEHSRYCEENDEHPEWHNYEIAENVLTSKYTQRLYSIGYIRIGCRLAKNGGLMETNGFTEFNMKHAKHLKEIATVLGLKLTVVNIK